MKRPIPRPFPGVVWGDYPQRDAPPTAGGWAASWRALVALWPGRVGPYARFAEHVAARHAGRPRASQTSIDAALAELRVSLAARREWDEPTLTQAFGVASAALEAGLGVRPYQVQLIAARIMLDGRLAEMATGEGKTVAIALAAAVAALGHTPVHVITANDYLAARDAASMAPFYAALGIDVGVVTQPLQQVQRRKAWDSAVTYCTAKELAFDYLRDGMTRPRGLAGLERRALRLGAEGGPGGAPPMPAPPAVPLLRGLPMAVVDEADTVLIDEAGVPLVLSQPRGGPGEQAFLAEAARQAAALREGEHFWLGAGGGVTLTDEGRARLVAWPPAPPRAPGAHGDRRHREEALQLALTALHLLRRDRDYVVKPTAGGAEVVIIDPTTGRAAPGRAWSRGLHQLVELKEGCDATGRNVTVTQITYQRLFPRYLRLCGMSGTLAGSAAEFNRVYGLRTVAVPARLPSRRQVLPLALYPDTPSLWREVGRRVQALQASGRPVLVGTSSVAESEQLSAVLAELGVAHALLNARQDAGEADIVAAAGRRGRVTVATSMAGRGTDVALGEGVAALGGLHVILCQHNASRRIDRQFMGRAARRGEPGSVQVMLALDTPLFVRWLPAWSRRLLAGPVRWPPLLHLAVRLPQWCASYTQRSQRYGLCRAEEETERAMIFNRETFS